MLAGLKRIPRLHVLPHRSPTRGLLFAVEAVAV